MIGSRLFQRIAYAVFESPNEASIKKDFILFLYEQYGVNETKMKKLFNELVEMFGDKNEMKVIGNIDLNKLILKNMAMCISSDISKANETAASNIEKRLYLN